MAYCASALSFMFENLGKPIVLTGSMVPLCELYNDARRNLIVAIVIAGYVDVPEGALEFANPYCNTVDSLDRRGHCTWSFPFSLLPVCVFVNDKLTRGNRTVKTNSMGLDAFDSPNFPALVKLETGLRIHSERFVPPPRGRFRVRTVMDMNIAVVKLVPGFSDDFLFSMLAHTPSLRGIIFELYGSGNAAARRSRLLHAIEDALRKDIIVVVCSQCHRGAVQLDAYALGRNLARLGVISAIDMTTEATATKLGYLLGLGLPVPRVKELMTQRCVSPREYASTLLVGVCVHFRPFLCVYFRLCSLRGELSENDEYLTPQGSSLHAIMARVAREDSSDAVARQQLLPPGSPSASLLRSEHPIERRRASPVANEVAPGGRRYHSPLATLSAERPVGDRPAGRNGGL